MGNLCTSVMKLVTEEDGTLKVNFCATHYGHDGFKDCRELMNAQQIDMRKTTHYVKTPERSKMLGFATQREKKKKTEEETPVLTTDMKAKRKRKRKTQKVKKHVQSKIVDIATYKKKKNTVEERLTTKSYVDDSDDLMDDDDAGGMNSSYDDNDEHCTHSNSPPASAKERLVSNLREIVNVIENCDSQEVLDIVAFGIDEVVKRFKPLVNGIT